MKEDNNIIFSHKEKNNNSNYRFRINSKDRSQVNSNNNSENISNVNFIFRSKSKFNYERPSISTLIVVIMTSFITTFTGSALNLSIPAISNEFQASATSVVWISTGYILASAALSVPFGNFADLYGRKPVLITGSIIFTICSLLCAFSWNIQSIILFRLIQGIGASMIFATNTAILVSSYPPQSRGKMLGLSTFANYLGHSLGPAAGGIINQYLGWQAVFYITAAYCFVIIILAIAKLKEPHSLQHKRGKQKIASLDISGCLLYTSAITFSMYGLTSIMSGWLPKIILIIGILLIIIFVSHESKTPFPIINVELFKKNKAFTFSNLATLLNHGTLYAVNYLLSIYLQNVQGYSPQISGIILITSPVFQSLLSPLAGHLSDRKSPYKLASAGMIITTAGIFMFAFISSEMSLLCTIATLAIAGTGFGIFSSPNSNAVLGSVKKDQYSVASSVMATSRSLGHTASMAVVSSVITITLGNTTLADAPINSIVDTMRISFIIFTVLSLLGTYFSARGK